MRCKPCLRDLALELARENLSKAIHVTRCVFMSIYLLHVVLPLQKACRGVKLVVPRVNICVHLHSLHHHPILVFLYDTVLLASWGEMFCLCSNAHLLRRDGVEISELYETGGL